MTSQLRKINNVIEQFLLPLAEAVSGWSTLAAIRSALIVTLPLMFLGSLAELLISFPLDAYKEFMFRQFGPEWRMFGQILKDATFSVMSLIMVFSIGHHLTDQFNHDNPVLRANPVIAGLVAFTAFFCLLQQDGDALNRRWLGVAGLFVAKPERSRGVGKQLLDAAKAAHDYLELRVYAENWPAVKFYYREGFTLCSQDVDGSTGADEYLMAWWA